MREMFGMGVVKLAEIKQFLARLARGLSISITFLRIAMDKYLFHEILFIPSFNFER